MRKKIKSALLYIHAALRWVVILYIIFIWGIWYDWKIRRDKFNWWDK